MQEVAHHLQIHAHTHGLAGAGKDAFARSAYNRYYYGCFLALRTTLAEMDPKWAKIAHKSYPDVLSGAIANSLKGELKRSRKNGDMELEKLLESALRSTQELSKIMMEANAVRIVADYKPSIAVDFTNGKRFSLNEIEIDRAHRWHGRISALTGSLRSAWRQVNA